MTFPSSTVINAFLPITRYLEGDSLLFMYKDNLGLVTTGTGNLIDSPSAAIEAGTWYKPDGSAATDDEVTANWNLVKNDNTMDVLNGGAQYEHLLGNDLRLTQEGVDNLVSNKIQSNAQILKSNFPNIESWPLQAQLGLLLMSWGLGPNFKYPKFKAAVSAMPPDFATAADESTWSNINQNRDDIQTQLFLNADVIMKNNLPLDTMQGVNATSVDPLGESLVSNRTKSSTKQLLKYGAVAFVGYQAYKHRKGIYNFVTGKAGQAANAVKEKVASHMPGHEEKTEPKPA